MKYYIGALIITIIVIILAAILYHENLSTGEVAILCLCAHNFLKTLENDN